ncbi:MAG: hypothetical protein Q8R11_01520, partial [bacterium]|nr:hypothetical protein [bacterium]
MLPTSFGILLEGGSVLSRKMFVDTRILNDIPPFDVFRVGGVEPSIGINDVRRMKRAVSLKHIRPYKVVIEEAQQLTIPAQNALLKILEEPPENVQFVLTVPHRGRLLPTIQSRLNSYHIDESLSE